MNVTGALHTQTLLTWLTDPHAVAPDLADAARYAAAALADAARRRVGGGMTGHQVIAGWPALLTGYAGCPNSLTDPSPDRDWAAVHAGDLSDEPDTDRDDASDPDADAHADAEANHIEKNPAAQGVLAGRLA